MQTWNERFAEALAESGIGLAEFSRRADLSHVAALRWIGTPSMKPAQEAYASSLLRACRALDVRVEWILEGELPKRYSEAWPFTTARRKIESLSVVYRVLLDKIVADIVETLTRPREPDDTT